MKKNIVLLAICSILIVIFFTNAKPRKEETPAEVIPFGKQNNWLSYNFTHEKILKKKKVRSVKVVFYQQEKENSLSYLVSIKRSTKSEAKKDGRYEFLGGKVDKKEKILAALIREVAEEDPSLVLAKQLKWITNTLY